MNLPSFAPPAAPKFLLSALAASQRSLLMSLFTPRTTVITGAGVSTASGIPDYRSPGRPVYKPLQHMDFIKHDSVRRRYWCRSMVGWAIRIHIAVPNACHLSLAELGKSGRLGPIITQNVDGLHSKAGSPRVLELHGSLRRVHCLDCGFETSRERMQDMLAESNPSVYAKFCTVGGTASEHVPLRPDGDVELPDHLYESFEVPKCPCCGSQRLKPCVTFYGGNVDRNTVEASMAMIEDSSAVLVLGSTLHVFSAYRLARRASELSIPIVVVNYGDTRGDPLATFRFASTIDSFLSAVGSELLSPSSS